MNKTIKEMTTGYLGQSDVEAIKILDSFLPEKLFDAHMHVSHVPIMNREILSFSDYLSDMRVFLGNSREICANMIPFPTKSVKTDEERKESNDYLLASLKEHENSVGEILVTPTDSAEYIESQLNYERIRGLKCYHVYANREDTFNSGIEEYLPESAFEVANKHGLSITLHMVRDKALADEGNRKYIKEMAKKYPNAKLILAHAARAFAAWTAIDYIDELRPYANIFCDFSGVCESPAMIAILKSFGVCRCMWGTDWPISTLAGKCISLGDTFYWIGENDLRSFKSSTALNSRLVGTESLMAVREACKLTGLSRTAIEDLFYNTAYNVFKK